MEVIELLESAEERNSPAMGGTNVGGKGEKTRVIFTKHKKFYLKMFSVNSGKYYKSENIMKRHFCV